MDRDPASQEAETYREVRAKIAAETTEVRWHVNGSYAAHRASGQISRGGPTIAALVARVLGKGMAGAAVAVATRG